MAKNFWERAEFRIEQFVQLFHMVYELYYNAPYEQTDERVMMHHGGRLMQAAENVSLLKAYMDATGDIFTSDRELAAFAVTYGVYENRYKA